MFSGLEATTICRVSPCILIVVFNALSSEIDVLQHNIPSVRLCRALQLGLSCAITSVDLIKKKHFFEVFDKDLEIACCFTFTSAVNCK